MSTNKLDFREDEETYEQYVRRVLADYEYAKRKPDMENHSILYYFNKNGRDGLITSDPLYSILTSIIYGDMSVEDAIANVVAMAIAGRY